MAEEKETPKKMVNPTDKSYVAATHDTDLEVKNTHPGKPGHARDEIGRASDSEKKFEEETKMDDVDRETPM